MDRIVSLRVRVCADVILICVFCRLPTYNIIIFIYLYLLRSRELEPVFTCVCVYFVVVVRSDVLPQPSDETVLGKANIIILNAPTYYFIYNMRNNNIMYYNFFSVLKLNPLRTFHVENLTSPVTPCHVHLYTFNLYILYIYETYEISIRDWVTI